METPAPTPAASAAPIASSSYGASEKTRAGLAYLFLWFSAIFFIITEGQSGFVLFHAWQCFLLVLVFIPLWIIAFAIDIYAIPMVFSILGFIVWMIFLVIWGICLVTVFTRGPGNPVLRLPLLGTFAHKIASKKLPVS